MAVPSRRRTQITPADPAMAALLRPADQWPTEREGYSGKIPVAYAGVPLRHQAATLRRWLRLEERFGSLVAGGGIVWTTQAVTSHFPGLEHISLLPPGPLETCALGILVWLHAKWRRSLRVN